MPIKIRAADARNNFAEILGRAHFGGETFLIEKQGKPFAVVLGIEEYRRLLGSPSEGSEDSGEPDSRQRNGNRG
jgi:prevent-host-death family protein